MSKGYSPKKKIVGEGFLFWKRIDPSKPHLGEQLRYKEYVPGFGGRPESVIKTVGAVMLWFDNRYVAALGDSDAYKIPRTFNNFTEAKEFIFSEAYSLIKAKKGKDFVLLKERKND